MTETPERDEFEGLVEAYRDSLWGFTMSKYSSEKQVADARGDLMHAFDVITAERDDLLQRREFMQAISAGQHATISTLTWLSKSYRQRWLDAAAPTAAEEAT